MDVIYKEVPIKKVIVREKGDIEVEFSDGSKENKKIRVLARADVFAGFQMVLL